MTSPTRDPASGAQTRAGAPGETGEGAQAAAPSAPGRSAPGGLSRGRPFVKMNGLGNDFVVVQSGAEAFEPDPAAIKAWGDRAAGIGFDQLIALSAWPGGVQIRFWNADGEEVGACGNGSRCAADLLMQATGASHVELRTRDRLLTAWREGAEVAIDLGAPGLDWRDIPLAEEMDTRGVELQVGPIDRPLLHTPGCVSMGNPHVVFFVDDAERAPVRSVGSLIEHHPLFPEGVNVGFCQRLGPALLRNRVWERGAGLTKACGTGACAALVASVRRGLCERRAVVELDGGRVSVDWRQSDDHVILTGAVSVDFTGVLPA